MDTLFKNSAFQGMSHRQIVNRLLKKIPTSNKEFTVEVGIMTKEAGDDNNKWESIIIHIMYFLSQKGIAIKDM